MDGGMTTKIKGDATSTFGSDIDVAGNVVTDAPAFRAKRSTDQSIAHNTFTKIAFDSVLFDETNDYDEITNYRFTPSVKGYYYISVNSSCTSIANGTICISSIYKNGSEIHRGTQVVNGANGTIVSNASTILYMNGSTDYLEFYIYQSSGVSKTVGTNERTNNATAVLVRAS